MNNKTINLSRINIKNKVFTLFLLLVFMITLVGCETDQPIEQDTITVTFDTGVEGITMEPITGLAGKNISDLEQPIREGYSFTGWEDKNGIPFNGRRYPSKSLTVYATWELLSNMPERRIDFLSNSDEYIEPMYFREGEVIEGLPKPTYYSSDGYIYTFKEWKYETVDFDLEVMPSHNIVLSAEWNKGDVAIYFDTGTDITIDPVVQMAGEKIEPPEELFTKDNHLFMGWEYENEPYIFDTMPTSDITLQAKWFETTGQYKKETTVPKLFINLDNDKDLSTVDRIRYVESTVTLVDEESSSELLSVSAYFRGRGNGSWIDSGPKRGYRIKFFDKQKPFDEKKSKHWVLTAGANFYDPTLLKTKLAFDLSNETFSNIEYTSSANWVELYVNGEYRGMYVLTEHVRVQNNRVEIDSEFGVLDTGYLIEYDAYANQGILGVDYFMVDGYRYGFTIKSPDSDDFLEEGITEQQFKQQVQYIKNYTSETLTAALNSPNSSEAYATFEEKADVASFVDMYILHELFKNTDTGWSSFFMYKKAGGKLYAGPPWDFDASAGTNRGNQTPYGIFVAGSVEQESELTASELYLALLQVDEFKQAVELRYAEIYDGIITFINENMSQEFIDENQEAFAQNFYFWSQNRSSDGMVGAYTVYNSLESARTGWEREVNNLKDWLTKRANWLKNEWS